MADGVRLDAELVRRGLARSRGVAQTAIAEGRVRVAGRSATKPSVKVDADIPIEVDGDDGYVSRAAHKLIAALDGFAVDPRGRRALDVGASTGGFTQVLLERGAAAVTALDVGHGQLVDELRGDARVTVVEGENARDLTAERLAELTGGAPAPDLIVGDLSFISLALVLPALTAVAHPEADLLLLVKPQFEVGRGRVRGGEGIVRERGDRHAAVRAVLGAARDLGLGARGVLSSPIVGSTGNQEYLVHWTAGAPDDPTEWDAAIDRLP
ncbi:TlyA family RNA methyltransferase [Schumannella sp. 10F1B-5-1]|uniref:TlyA family RNA methyltransferase n=1 Tax=Schumannella sp. 10F1B-5-1 TaxID=2590780 RepID=UPI0011312D26|nr:TlyA family RNA methyltransferase [Schumannella sp. 10F1B-5-1]TPW73732.1 TlyA family RNA methyltransferase [Schumannella sp. 10F1B-5-1]